MSKKISRLILGVAALFAMQISVFSQNAGGNWVRLESDNGEFSIELPNNEASAYFYDKDGFYYNNNSPTGPFNFKEIQMLYGALDKTYMRVEIYRMPNPEVYLNEISRRRNFVFSKIKTDRKEFDIYKAEFDRSYEKIRELTENINFEIRYISSDTHFYTITVWNRGKSNPISERFLSSMRLGAPSSGSAGEKVTKISALKPVTIEQIGGQLSKQEADSVTDSPKIKSGTPGELFVLHVPPAGANFASPNMRAKGVIRFKTTYSKDGRVSRILLVSGLPGGLNRLAFFSVLRTKFLPAEENGEPKTIERVIVYDYTDIF
ncbi:MAG TPA: hypothetical protein VIL74_25800 [Pyrinomonadaceae bacterium]|jgi:hypothetical protein